MHVVLEKVCRVCVQCVCVYWYKCIYESVQHVAACYKSTRVLSTQTASASSLLSDATEVSTPPYFGYHTLTLNMHDVSLRFSTYCAITTDTAVQARLVT
jgi:hypothetical protein